MNVVGKTNRPSTTQRIEPRRQIGYADRDRRPATGRRPIGWDGSAWTDEVEISDARGVHTVRRACKCLRKLTTAL